MVFPIIPIAIGIGAISLSTSIHSTMKSRKWQKVHNEALESARPLNRQRRSWQMSSTTKQNNLVAFG